MDAKIRIVLRLLLAMAALAALVPAVALARPVLDEYDGWWGYRGWGTASNTPAWCHTGDYGATALSDRATLGRVAGALGITPARLSAGLRNGDTVADIAAERGVRIQAAVDAALARHRDIVRWRVEDGYIARNQAEEVLASMDEQLRAALEQGTGQDFGWGPAPRSGSYGSDPAYPTYGGFGMGPGMMGGWGPAWGPGGMMGRSGW